MIPIHIIKLGSSVVDNPHALATLLTETEKLDGGIILVHGGGKTATEYALRAGIKQVMTDGRRITDRDTLDVVVMVYGGLVNKRIVASIVSRGRSALGLCGADLDIIRAQRRNPYPVDYGFVGDIVEVRADILRRLCTESILVIAPITHDGNGQLLNSNADGVAATIASALAPDSTLTFTFDKAGILADPDSAHSLLPQITRSELNNSTARITDGMLPKIHAAFAAVESGVQNVRITHYGNLSGGTSVV